MTSQLRKVCYLDTKLAERLLDHLGCCGVPGDGYVPVVRRLTVVQFATT